MLILFAILLIVFAVVYKKIKQKKANSNSLNLTSNQNRSNLSVSSTSSISNQYASYTNLNNHDENSIKKLHKSKKLTDKEILNLDKSYQPMPNQFECANVS